MTTEPTHPGTLSSRALAYEQGYSDDEADHCPSCGGVGVSHVARCPSDPWAA